MAVLLSDCLTDEDQDHRHHDGKGLHVRITQSLQKSLAWIHSTFSGKSALGTPARTSLCSLVVCTTRVHLTWFSWWRYMWSQLEMVWKGYGTSCEWGSSIRVPWRSTTSKTVPLWLQKLRACTWDLLSPRSQCFLKNTHTIQWSILFHRIVFLCVACCMDR